MKRRSVKSRVRERRKQQKREFLLIMSVFTLMLGGWFWYHFIYIRTPEYAMRQIAQAFATRDAEKAERFIDFDRVLDSAYDDLTDDLLYYDAALTEETRMKYEAFYDVIKPQIVHGLRETLHRYAEQGEWLLPGGDDLTKGRQLGIDFERFLERSQLRNTEVLRSGGDFHLQNSRAEGRVEIRDRHSQTEFPLSITMEQEKDGHWQVIRLDNYRQYLDTIAPRQNRDIADYIAATRDIVLTYNDELEDLKVRFGQLTKGTGGSLSEVARPLGELIRNEIIPTLKERQARLDEVVIPSGAQYLANQRHVSTDLAIAAWQHYIKAAETGSYEEFNVAETLKKQEIETDLRITDIIRHNTVSQALPEIP